MFRFACIAVMVLCWQITTLGSELPPWVDSVSITHPSLGGIGSLTLSGQSLDTCIPDAISHSMSANSIDFEVTQPNLNVACGDAITPWSLTEEFGPLLPGTFSIQGSLVSVDPQNRSVRELVSGPDRLGQTPPPLPAAFHGLGRLFDEAYVSAAFDVSADGNVVVGHNELAPGTAGLITSEAFAWTPSTGMFGLGLLPGGIPGGSTAFGVSADGNVIVGDSQSDIMVEAFRWTLGGGMQGLGGFIDPSVSRATAASRDGSVVVGSDEFFGPVPVGFTVKSAFRWTPQTGLVDLGHLQPGGSSESTDVSADGEVVVGNSSPNASIEIAFADRSEPFRWTAETGMVGLGHLSSPIDTLFPSPNVVLPSQRDSTAAAVSADGQHVVGTSRELFAELGVRIVRAFHWTEEDGMQDLGQLPSPGFAEVEAVDVSEDGTTVVGMQSFESLIAAPPSDFFGSVAFIWDPVRGMRSLEEVLRNDFGLGASGELDGWILGRVGAISDDGTTIVGTGINPDGEQEAWRAVIRQDHIPGDTDFDGDIDQEDALVMAANFGAGIDGEAVYWNDGDFDANGRVDIMDVLLMNQNMGPNANSVAAVPEPTASVLACLACLGLILRSRRSVV